MSKPKKVRWEDPEDFAEVEGFKNNPLCISLINIAGEISERTLDSGADKSVNNPERLNKVQQMKEIGQEFENYSVNRVAREILNTMNQNGDTITNGTLLREFVFKIMLLHVQTECE